MLLSLLSVQPLLKLVVCLSLYLHTYAAPGGSIISVGLRLRKDV